MTLMLVFVAIQLLSAILSVTFNLMLIFIVLRHPAKQNASYQRLIVAYAVFELTYSIIIALAMPVHYMSSTSWVIYSYSGLLVETPIAKYGASLDCTFFEIWLGFMCLHFIYRYVNTREGNLEPIIFSERCKTCTYAICIFSYVSCTFFCGFYLCRRQANDPNFQPLVESFGLDPKKPFYTIIATNDRFGHISIYGHLILFIHNCLLFCSLVTILFCSWKISRAIFSLKLAENNARRLLWQRQVFYSLISQVLAPMFFCHIPTSVYFSMPYASQGDHFGLIPLFFTCLSSAVKFINPILVIICIQDYRQAVFRIFKRRKARDSDNLELMSV